MEKINEALQARVWQRVQGKAVPAGSETPQQLAGELALRYRQLSSQMPGQGEQFRHLSGQIRKTQACLAGLCRIRGCADANAVPAAGKEDPRHRITKCCHLERRLGEALDQLSSDGEWGKLYGLLAEQASQRCMTLLEILGSLQV